MNFNFLFSHTEVSDSQLNQKKATHNQTKIIINMYTEKNLGNELKELKTRADTPDGEGII